MRYETIIPAGVDDTAPRAARGVRVAGALATVAALAILAGVIAYWGWQIAAPSRVHIPAATPADPSAALLASGLFAATGAAPAGDDIAAPQVLGGDVRLLGVFAEPNGRGYALFRTASGPRLVAAGKDIAPGAALTEVRPDGIRVREAGGERSIDLRAPAAPPPSTPAAPSGAVKSSALPSTARNACAPPAGFKGDVVALNAELMGGLIAQPDSWRALVEASNGALVVRDDSGFSAMLGLKRGDRIAQANGIALTAPDDIVGAVLRPLAARQTVRVSGSRDGAPRELWLRNVTC